MIELPTDLLDYILCTLLTDNELCVIRLVCREWNDRVCRRILEKRVHAGQPILKLDPSKFVCSLDMLKFAHSAGCPLTSTLFNCIIDRGDFKMLKWARANGCPWNVSIRLRAYMWVSVRVGVCACVCVCGCL